MGFLELFFGAKRDELSLFLKKEVIVLDVRTLREYETNHIKNSMHLPLNDLNGQLEALKSLNTPFVVCCESGVRSAKAARILKQNGMDAINGGGWKSLSEKLKV